MTEHSPTRLIEMTARGSTAIVATAVYEKPLYYGGSVRPCFFELIGEGGQVAAIVANFNDKAGKSTHIRITNEGGETTSMQASRDMSSTTFKQLKNLPLYDGLYAGGTYNIDVMARKPIVVVEADDDEEQRPQRRTEPTQSFVMLLPEGVHPAERFYQMGKERLAVPMLEEWKQPVWEELLSLTKMKNMGVTITKLDCIGMAMTYPEAYKVEVKEETVEYVISQLGRYGGIKFDGIKPQEDA